MTLGRKHRGDNRQLIVGIGSTERPLREYVQAVSDVGKITTKRTSSEKHTPSFAYVATNIQALDLLEQSGIYLRTYKAKRCTLILSEYCTVAPRNGKYTFALTTRREQFEAKVLAIKPT